MLFIYITCTITLLIYPLVKDMSDNKARVYERRLREFRLSTIQKYYPELKKLSWQEIENSYSVRQLYDEIR